MQCCEEPVRLLRRFRAFSTQRVTRGNRGSARPRATTAPQGNRADIQPRNNAFLPTRLNAELRNVACVRISHVGQRAVGVWSVQLLMEQTDQAARVDSRQSD